mmetsp:Transcript_51755/g.92316  ORF Transcript_51755/g.92316 Transcript_51755/m.92316 type:complete len:117 (-) Transcript_51755:1195-1545(-)
MFFFTPHPKTGGGVAYTAWGVGGWPVPACYPMQCLEAMKKATQVMHMVWCIWCGAHGDVHMVWCQIPILGSLSQLSFSPSFIGYRYCHYHYHHHYHHHSPVCHPLCYHCDYHYHHC